MPLNKAITKSYCSSFKIKMLRGGRVLTDEKIVYKIYIQSQFTKQIHVGDKVDTMI